MPAEVALSPRREWAVLASVVLGAFTGPLNSTVIVLALPAIGHGLTLPPGSTTWLVTVYLIASGALLPVAGKLGDRRRCVARLPRQCGRHWW